MASLYLLVGAAVSLLVGFGIFMAALLSSSGVSGPMRRRRLAAGVIGAVAVNSWWVLILAIVFFKFVVLRQDT